MLLNFLFHFFEKKNCQIVAYKNHNEVKLTLNACRLSHCSEVRSFAKQKFSRHVKLSELTDTALILLVFLIQK